MNLSRLFEQQKELDAHIESEHPRQPGEDRLAKKILALQVELGELANEWRGFKFWSNDQEPRIKEPITARGKPYRNPLLEEYVDGLHFILSIGLELEIDNEVDMITIEDQIEFEPYYKQDIFEQFKSVFYFASQATSKYKKLFNAFVGLGEFLGYEWEEVEEAYDQKNAINHTRQEQSY